MPDAGLAVAACMGAGILGGLFSTPLTLGRSGWAWESTWLVYSLLAYAVFPWLAAAATVLPMHRETEIDETTTDPATDAANVQKDLRYRLQRMSLKLSEQERRHTSEIVRLRKENERLLLAATRSRR